MKVDRSEVAMKHKNPKGLLTPGSIFIEILDELYNLTLH